MDDFINGFFDKGFYHILIAEVVAAFDGVVSMQVQVVVFSQDRCRATFGRDGVTSHGIDFGDYANICTLINFRCGNCSTQARTPSTYQEHVVFGDVHEYLI